MLVGQIISLIQLSDFLMILYWIKLVNLRAKVKKWISRARETIETKAVQNPCSSPPSQMKSNLEDKTIEKDYTMMINNRRNTLVDALNKRQRTNSQLSTSLLDQTMYKGHQGRYHLRTPSNLSELDYSFSIKPSPRISVQTADLSVDSYGNDESDYSDIFEEYKRTSVLISESSPKSTGDWSQKKRSNIVLPPLNFATALLGKEGSKSDIKSNENLDQKSELERLPSFTGEPQKIDLNERITSNKQSENNENLEILRNFSINLPNNQELKVRPPQEPLRINKLINPNLIGRRIKENSSNRTLNSNNSSGSEIKPEDTQFSENGSILSYTTSKTNKTNNESKLLYTKTKQVKSPSQQDKNDKKATRNNHNSVFNVPLDNIDNFDSILCVKRSPLIYLNENKEVRHNKIILPIIDNMEKEEEKKEEFVPKPFRSKKNKNTRKTCHFNSYRQNVS